ncbi:MAG TPA: hypothetical protein VLM40_19850, partial [Gemmata sp.]|nr:hypothetical protein [Gemmata sp.]
WRAMFASVGNNPIYTQYMPPDPVWLTIISLDIGLLLPFILLLLVALVVAWLDRFERSIDVRRFPRLEKAWPVRKTTIAVAAGLALLFLLIQLARGFGMERAIRTSVRDNPEIKKAREDAAGYPSREAGVENRVEAEMAKYNLERTWWQDIAVLSLLVAVLATILSIRLDKRGNKPPPRIVLHY